MPPPGQLHPTDEPAEKPTVLIVDDSATLRALLSAQLSSFYRCVQASSAEQGQALAQQLGPDLILSDVNMAPTDGYQFCRWIREDPRLASTPFVMLTSNDDVDSRLQGLE